MQDKDKNNYSNNRSQSINYDDYGLFSCLSFLYDKVL